MRASAAGVTFGRSFGAIDGGCEFVNLTDGDPAIRKGLQVLGENDAPIDGLFAARK
jgi:hypothetical protein